MGPHLALKPFKKGKPAEVEGVRKVEVENDSWLEKVLEQYDSLEKNKEDPNYHKTISNLDKIILEPEKIDVFLKYIIAKDNIKRRTAYEDSSLTGLYITKLIQDSYNEGNNNFVLHTQKSLIDYLGYNLHGKENKNINITINGSAGGGCGNRSKHANFYIKGNTGDACGLKSEKSNFTIQGDVEDDCGHKSTNSTFTINGNAGKDCGQYSEDSTFTIKGNTGDACGQNSTNSTFTINGNAEDGCGFRSEKSNFTINGNIGKDCGLHSKKSTFTINGNAEKGFGKYSEDSTYRTPNKKTYEKMKEDIFCLNPIQLLGPNGEVLKRGRE